jgi:hypothetical protein
MGKFHSILIQSLKFLAGIVIGLILSVLIIVSLEIVLDSPNPFEVPNPNLWLIGAVISVCILFSTWVVFKVLAYKEIETKGMSKLPSTVSELIGNIICNMRYRRKVRAEVSQELADHFADALGGCKDEAQRGTLAHEMIEGFGDAKLLGVLLRRAKKRCRPMWRIVATRSFQALGILVLFLIAHCVYLSFARPVISVNYIEKATGLNRPVADENTNAAVLYNEAFELYKDEPMIEVQEEGKSWAEEMKLLQAISRRERISELSKEELSLMRQWIDDNQEALEKFKAGSKRINCWWERGLGESQPMISCYFEELTPTRDLAKLICWRGKLYAADGKYKEAIDDLLCCYRAGRHFRGPRSLITQLVGIAIQALSVSSTRIVVEDNKIDSGLLGDIQAEFEQFKSADDFIMNYKVERFFILDLLQRCYTDNGRGGGRMIPGQMAEFEGVFGSPDSGDGFLQHSMYLGLSLVSVGREDMKREFNKTFDLTERYANKTPWQLQAENIDLSPDFDRWPKIKQARYLLVCTLMPALARCNVIAHRSRTEIDAFITTISLLRYERKNAEYPESLELLVEGGLLKEMPMDPYSDKPLVYKRIDDGFTLYSVGEDFTDDGGKRNRPWGGGYDGGDRVFWPVETYEQRMYRINEQKEKPKLKRRKKG